MVRYNNVESYNGNILNSPSQPFIQSLNQAHQYLQQNEKQKALSICIKLLEQGGNDEIVLKALVQIYFSIEQVTKAMDCLLSLACLHMGNLTYCQQLENVCRRYNNIAKAVLAYEHFIDNNPTNANGFFNFGLLLKKEGKIKSALEHYQQALLLNIEFPEEVLVNMAVIHLENFQVSEALSKLNKALQFNPEYIPALQNKASIFEGSGKLEQAKILYEKTLKLDPKNILSISRLTFCYKHESKNAHSLIAKSKELLNKHQLIDEDKESLLYAIGKIYDDIKDYENAFQFYQQANTLSQTRVSKYIPDQIKAKFDLVKLQFTKKWFNNLSSEHNEKPIFIVGMFRSGSTLVEQILASHPSIISGGELSYFPELAKALGVENNNTVMSDKDIKKNVRQYLAIRNAISSDKKVTDKRPDNFLFIGLIKTIFPKAKFIWTIRDKADTCLSNYFLQLDSSMNYANNLDNLNHYYDQHMALLVHWMSIFPEDICIVNYDKLIVDIENEITPALTFLGESWVEECKNFSQLKNHVQTASMWQVRQPLYKSSSGRAKQYNYWL